MSTCEPTRADVTLILEGTYPYVAGGVSTWVHQILTAFPARRFALLHIGPYPGAYGRPAYQLPPNVVGLSEVSCRGERAPGRRRRAAAPPAPRRPSRTLAALGRLHLGDEVDDALLADLAANDLGMAEFLHGDAAFDLVRELYQRCCAGAPFSDLFWHVRAMHVPLLRVIGAACPEAALYHAVSTGYAGLAGAMASVRTGRPLVVTEHGIYARERELELSRTAWIHDLPGAGVGPPQPSPLRALWSHYFRMLSRVAYHRAARLVTLSAVNLGKQLADGADPAKATIVPNGVDAATAPDRAARAPGRLRVGFVGRVVPIKDVITLIRALALASEEIDLEAWIVGPESEDPAYAARCHALVAELGLEDRVRFLGARPVAEIYPQLDVLLLTSISEGLPLVILEAYAAALPVVASDVGACRELVLGGDPADRALGPSGIVTRVASPRETAAALVRLARDPALARTFGESGAARLAARYRLGQVVARYDDLYASMVRP